MNKQEMLRDYKKSEDKMCLSQVLDKIESSANRNKIEYTDFLDMYQTALVETFLRKNNFQNYKLYGGYEEAERKILIIYPEKYNEEMLAKNYNKMISILRIQLPEEEQGKLVHRNYLGGIVKLGLKREKVGDILVSNDGANIIAKKEFIDKYEQKVGDYYISSIVYGYGYMKIPKCKKQRISYITLIGNDCKPIWGYVIPR